MSRRFLSLVQVQGDRAVQSLQLRDLPDPWDPLALLQSLELEGVDGFVLQDASTDLPPPEVLLNLVDRVSRQVFLPLAVGGHLRDLLDAQSLLAAGCDRIIWGDAVVRDPPLLARAANQLGRSRVAVALDVRQDQGIWQVMTRNGRVATGLDPLELARRCATLGAGELIVRAVNDQAETVPCPVNLIRVLAGHLPIPLVICGVPLAPSQAVDLLTAGQADALLLDAASHCAQDVAIFKQVARARGLSVRDPSGVQGSPAVG